MLSALEEQGSGFFWGGGVFNYLRMIFLQKRTVTAKLSSRYCSSRIVKANAVTHGSREKRKGYFWRRPIGLLDVILGSLAFYLVQLTSLEIGQVSYLLSSPWTRQSEEGFWNAPSPANWGKPARLTTHRLSLAREGWRTLGHHHACQFPTARSENWAMPTKFWFQQVKGVRLLPLAMLKWTLLHPESWGPFHGRGETKYKTWVQPGASFT